MQHAATDSDTDPTRARIRDLVRARGVQPVARELGMSRHAIASLASPAPVRAGTLALARERIAAREG